MRFLAAEEAAADAMAGMTAIRPESWNEIDDLVRGFGLLLHDSHWALSRLTDIAEDLRPLHPGVAERMRWYVKGIARIADESADLQDFSMVGPKAY